MANKRKRTRRYVFSLVGVNIEKVDQKYGIGSSTFTDEDPVPENTTKIVDLDIAKRTPEVVSFLDESKRLRDCTVSMIDFNFGKDVKKCGYKCFWDRNVIPDSIQVIGCPIKYVASRAIKTYHSEISKDKYSISECITEKRYEEIKNRKDKRLTLETNSYYETDGVFCSFNCVMAFIEANKFNPLYKSSETLALKMYEDLHGERVDEILPAPHWRTLKEHGGHLTIEQYRETFNKVEYVNHGIITYASLGRLFEDKLKF